MSTTAKLFIDGHWTDGEGKETLDVQNPASNENFGSVAVAEIADLDRAVEAASRAFSSWRNVSAYERGNILKAAARKLSERIEEIAPVLTREQGKPLAEARMEIRNSVALIEWFAEEARRAYGREIPSRARGVTQTVRKEPVGPTAAFTPWNFPIAQSTRKISAALAAGCTIVLKGAEETPFSVAALVKCFEDAGLPAGVVSLVFGNPARISGHLIAHPLIRKVSFTGSTPVGKGLAQLAGRHMKRGTFELGGHAPAIVCADANLDKAIERLAGAKYRNAGQVCISPTRFLVEEDIYETFVERFTAKAQAVSVGDGMSTVTTMGPLANPRRIEAMERLIADAKANNAEIKTGGRRMANKGNFFEPTVIADISTDAAAMNEEPFGPLALMRSFRSLDDAIAEANRLNYGLAAYAYTSSAEKAQRISNEVETGMLSMNHHGLGLPETPFGGVKDSGYGSEGGLEAVEAYQTIKFVSHAAF
ncbi:NAD-dependent succinate-semialdehyde dehydrogenase [Mesorhizobium sp. YR577]|uniref:NAD-dependent succinate-semialdehyde dehydrogenase n=1 Tax=Mesorhizobium sp. YR577 TaxID=1884373 RepID=UPI0008EA4A06|nr:NAD-dependent succinate-semialdehyde dehydrogenase [Mesorhizobium sp. YR577]SFU11280.1 succinate-semialdehyde dehydrogenase / glutarate-semialdehyde dehydrogenase [Mesorhizobium sp. YR577]